MHSSQWVALLRIAEIKECVPSWREGRNTVWASDSSSSWIQWRGRHLLGTNYCLLFLPPFPAVPLATILAMLEMAQSTMIQTSAGGQFEGLMPTDCIWWVSETSITFISLEIFFLLGGDLFLEIMCVWVTENVKFSVWSGLAHQTPL